MLTGTLWEAGGSLRASLDHRGSPPPSLTHLHSNMLIIWTKLGTETQFQSLFDGLLGKTVTLKM